MNRTEQRRIIIQELQKSQKHCTAEELFNVVKRRLPQISLGTIYRNLELLTNTNSVRKHINGKKKAHYEWNDKTIKYHTICPQCGTVSYIEFSQKDELIKLLQEICNETDSLKANFNLTKICPSCRSLNEQKAEELQKLAAEKAQKILIWQG